MSDETPNPLEGLLSEFSLGPSWARAKSNTPSAKTHERGEREYQPRRSEGRDDNRGGDRRGGGRNDRNDRRDNRDGGGARRQGGGGNRRDDRSDRGRPERRFEEIAPAEGVNVSLYPEKNAIQLVCKEVHQVARVYPLFDIAQIVLAERDRLRATFEINEKKPAFLRCKIEDAVFLTREEALRYMLQADWRHRFIEESTVEVDSPKGNFQSVAKCGISGEWLGPPNYHEYQTNIRRIHRERFANMPFEAYSAKVRTERSEEAVNEWLDSMKNQTRWRILSSEEIAAREEAASKPPEEVKPEAVKDTAAESATPPETADSEVVPEPAAPEDSTSEPAAETEEVSEATPEPSATESPAEEPVPETSENAPEEQPEAETPAEETLTAVEHTWYTDRAEFERTLGTEVLDRVFHTTRKAKVSAAIVGKNLSPGLLVRLKGTGNHHKKHPAILIPSICKCMEAEHMPVFKRKGKLFTGPARPQSLAADAILAPRPAEMVKWIRENTPAKLEGLWKAVLPEGSTAPPAEYAADLFWLLQQGHILLYTDDTLVVQEVPKPQEPKKPKKPKKKAEKSPSKENTETALTPEDNAAAKTSVPDTTLPETAPEAAQSETTPEPVVAEAAENDLPDPVVKIKDTIEKVVDAASSDKPEIQEEPVEIIKNAVEEIPDTVTDAATKLVDSAIEATPTESDPLAEEPSSDLPEKS